MAILIDLVVIAILIFNILMGYKKGLINVIFNICAFLIAIIATLILYKPVSYLIINNTDFDDKIKEVIIQNNIEDENIDVQEDNDMQENKNKTSLQEYIETKVEEIGNEAKAQAIEKVAEAISKKAVEILTGIILFIVIRIALVILKFLTQSISELPIIKQCNEIGGIIYGILKGITIIYILLTIMFLVVSIKGNSITADTIEESYVTKFLYENNIIVDYCLLSKNLL